MERDSSRPRSHRNESSLLARLAPIGLVLLVIVALYMMQTRSAASSENLENLLEKSITSQKASQESAIEKMTQLYKETLTKLTSIESKLEEFEKDQRRAATKFDALESGQDLVSAKLEGIATKLGAPNPVSTSRPKPEVCEPPVATDNLLTFYQIAKEEGTDKVSTHQYHHLYDKYLPELRKKPVRMMEIGLGCDMTYGPGRSLQVWRRYFEPNGFDLHFVEVDRACATLWAEKMKDVTVHIGDQGNRTFLQELKKKVGPGFDLIIDDGGHFMEMQQISLELLFELVKPGGYYVIEDLHTSYMNLYHDSKFPTTMEVVKGYLDAFYVGVGLDDPPRRDFPPFTKDILSIDCFHEACLFHKKKDVVIHHAEGLPQPKGTLASSGGDSESLSQGQKMMQWVFKVNNPKIYL